MSSPVVTPPPGYTLDTTPVQVPPGYQLDAPQGSSPDQPMTFGGFGGNVLKSAGKFVGDLAGPLLHLGDTLQGVTGLLEGMAEKSGSPPVAGQSHAQYVDALAKMYSDRYGGWDNFRKTLYNDPIGVLSDVAALAGAGGAASKGVELGANALKLGSVADAAQTAGKVAGTIEKVNPLSLAGKAADVTGLSGAADNFADWAAQRLRRGALKGGYNVNADPAAIDAAARTMGQQQIPFSQDGLTKINQALTDLQLAKQSKVGDAARAGMTVDPQAIATRIDMLKKSMAAQVNPTQDLADVEKVKQNFLAANPGPIPIDRAEAMKEGTYARNKYGPNVPPHMVATAEGEKALASGVMQEIGAQLPEVADINEGQSKLLGLQGVIEKAVHKYTNGGGFMGNLGKKLDLKTISLGAGGLTAAEHYGGPLAGAAAGAGTVMAAVLSDPMVKGRLAQAIEWGRKANPGKYTNPTGNGMARLNEYIGSLQPQQ